MQIELNGNPYELPEGTLAAELLTRLGLAQSRLAFEVNREIVPRSRLAQHALCPGDRVEIVRAIGGG